MANPSRTPAQERRRTKKKVRTHRVAGQRADAKDTRDPKANRKKEERMIVISLLVITFL
jgi:hypothetical protein